MGLMLVIIKYCWLKIVATVPLWALSREQKFGKDKTKSAQILHGLARNGPT